MDDPVAIRRALPADLAQTARLGGALARQHHAVDPDRFFLPERVEEGYAWWFERELDRAGAVVLVAVRGEEVIGYCYGALEERDWNLLLDAHGAIHDLLVRDDARGQGVGRRLVAQMIAELEALGAPRIVLSTMVGNREAQELARRCGFRPTMLEMTRDRGPGA